MTILDLLPDELRDELLPILEECELKSPGFSFPYNPWDKLTVLIVWLAREVVKLRTDKPKGEM